VSLDFIDTPSPNQDERALPVTMLVMHYTGMLDGASAIQRLADPEAKVSAHYVVAEDGQIVRMVHEDKRAWHAGKSFWRGVTDINSASIGIEIVNPGHAHGYRNFPDSQIESVLQLTKRIVTRHNITRGNVVGHSDIAPARKEDPGELFPWGLLARHRLALPRPTKNLMDPLWTDAGFLLALERFGYSITDPVAAVRAFQRRFRPELLDGVIDGECRAILLALLLPKPTGDG
jgi:N-acetylmuramoyl-L-alanine amidase